MYVDESGDSGMVNSPTRYFVLSGIVIHELRWLTYLEALVLFRKNLKSQFGLGLRDEFHAGKLVSKPGDLAKSIKPHRRVEMVRHYADALAGMQDLNVINVIVDKQGKGTGYDVFEMAWKALITRFQNTLSHSNFRGPRNTDDRGLLICDNTDNKKLIALRRRMGRHNPVPHHPHYNPAGAPLSYTQVLTTSLAEDPIFKNSIHSYWVQSADLTAFLAYQHIAPNKHMKKHRGQNFLKRLKPILCTAASRTDKTLGIVRL
jgi:hypothetical protein